MDVSYEMLPRETRKEVLGYFGDYERCRRKARVFSDYDECLAKARVRERMKDAPKEEIGREVSLALDEVRRQREEAETVVCVVEESIDSAVQRAPFADRKRIRQGLWDSLTRSVICDFLEINEKTLTKYRRLVIYDAAARLNLFTDAEDS